MSGLYISGIELPKECEYLDLVITKDGEVYCYDHEDVSVAKAVPVPAPTIEPKQGSWIDYKHFTMCSVCAANSEKQNYYRKGYRANYCPDCGARMTDC